MVLFKSIVSGQPPTTARCRRPRAPDCRAPRLAGEALGNSGRSEGSVIWWTSCDCGSLVIAPERTNVERFSLGGAAHWPLRGSHAVAGRAGERKTYWANPPAQLRRCPRDADADAVRLIHSAMVVNVGQWRPNERWNFRRERYNRRGYGADFANMGFVCLRLVAESKRCRQCCGAVATRG